MFHKQLILTIGHAHVPLIGKSLHVYWIIDMDYSQSSAVSESLCRDH